MRPKCRSREKFTKTPCCRPRIIINKRLNFNLPFENGRRDGQVAEYAITKSIPRHSGARQRNWGIAAKRRMDTRGRAAYGAGGSGLTRNDADLARRTWLDREYAQSATRDSKNELAAGRAHRGLGSWGRRAIAAHYPTDRE